MSGSNLLISIAMNHDNYCTCPLCQDYWKHETKNDKEQNVDKETGELSNEFYSYQLQSDRDNR